MTPFEQGYKAFLDGMPKDKNPFDGEKSPCSLNNWDRGWKRARMDRSHKS